MPYVRGYLLGQLFALLAAQGALEQSPEQLYQLASTAPPQVIPKALVTMIEAGKEEVLFPLLTRLPLDTFDGPLNRREQGAFAIGYAHGRMGSFNPLPEEEGHEGEPELTERYEFRIETQLKDWIKTNGGGPFLRTLLRSERSKSVQEIREHPPESGEEQ
jgi:hypothetical protein